MKTEIFSENEMSGHDHYELLSYLILHVCEVLSVKKEGALPFLLLRHVPPYCHSIQQLKQLISIQASPTWERHIVSFLTF